MATVKKRTWTKPNGETSEAWLLTWFDTNGKRHRKQFAKKREAEAERVQVEGQVQSGTFRSDAKRLTVADAVDNYAKHLQARYDRGSITQTYLDGTKAELETYVLGKPREDSTAYSRAVPFTEGIASVKLALLTPADVVSLSERLLAAGVTVATTRRVLASLRRTLAHAITKNHVATNAAKGVKVEGSRKDTPKKIVPPSKELMRTMLEAAPADLQLRMKFAAATGLRASEQWALRWRHLDLENGYVTVETRVDVHGVEDTTKSEAGKRTVPLGMPIVRQLKEWRKRTKFGADDHLVFPNSRGGYVRHGNLLKRDYNPLLDKLDGPRPNWHALRHFAVSTWIDAGLPPKTIQTFAGHATLAIIMDRYGHLFKRDDQKAAVDRIAEDMFS